MSDWGTVTLGYLSTQRKGINYKSEDYADEYSGHPFITIKCFVKGGGYEPTGIKFYNGFSTEMDHLSTGDILFSVTDLTRAGDIVGSPLRVPEFGGAKPTLASMDCMRIDPVASRCDKKFLYHRLMLSDIRRQMVAYSAGSTVLHLDTKKVPSIFVHVPTDVPTQGCIAAILDTIDQAIEKTEALIEKYQHIKAGLMHDLFTRGIGADGKLRPPREEALELYQETPIGWIPKEWGLSNISDLCSQIADCPHSTPTYRDSGIPCIRTADMQPGKLLLEQAYCVDEKDYTFRTQRLVPRADDIIYSREGERLGIASPVGREKVCLGQRVMILRPASDVDPSFLLWAMNHPEFYRRVVRGLGATTSPHVNVGDIQNIPTFVPLLKEQIAIGVRLKGIQSRLDRESDLKQKLLKNKSGLMHDLLTGKVPVKVEEPEVANV